MVEPAAEIITGQNLQLAGTHEIAAGLIMIPVNALMGIQSKLDESGHEGEQLCLLEASPRPLPRKIYNK